MGGGYYDRAYSYGTCLISGGAKPFSFFAAIEIERRYQISEAKA